MNDSERIEELCDRLCETLKAKNSNYGNAAHKPPFFLPWLSAESGLWVRLGDKIERLKTLVSKEPDKVGESLKDTLLDTAGYALRLIIEIEDKAEYSDKE